MKNSLNKQDFYRDYINDIKAKIRVCTLNLAKYTKDKMIIIATLNDKVRKYSKDPLLSLRSPVEEIYAYAKKFKSIDLYVELMAINSNVLTAITTKSKLETYKISLSTYCKFFDEYNKNGLKLLVKGLPFKIGGKCGKITVHRVQRKNTTSRKVNYIASNKYKKVLLDEGRTIYNKEDADRCKEAGIEYHGEDWRIYHFDDYYYYVDWKAFIPDVGEYYTFLPSRSYNLKIDREAIINSINVPEDIFQYSLGLIKYLYILDEMYPDFHTNFTSLSKI